MATQYFDPVLKNWYLYDSSSAETSITSDIFEKGFDDPTFMTFRVEFGDWGASVRDEQSIKTTTGTIMNAYHMDYDMYPMGLLDLNFYDDIDIASPRVKFNNTDNYYNAYNYLINRNEDVRAKYLMAFVEGIYEIQRKYPYLFTGITGLDKLTEFDSGRGQRLKDAEITLKCEQEGLSLKIRTLMELYRKAAWDDVYQRWILPQNYRQFKMIIYVFERRVFHGQNTSTSSDKFDLAYFNADLPVYAYECNLCEFLLGGNGYKSDYTTNYLTGDPETTDLRISVKNVQTYFKNPLMKKISGIMIYDLMSYWERSNIDYANTGTLQFKLQYLTKKLLNSDQEFNIFSEYQPYHWWVNTTPVAEITTDYDVKFIQNRTLASEGNSSTGLSRFGIVTGVSNPGDGDTINPFVVNYTNYSDMHTYYDNVYMKDHVLGQYGKQAQYDLDYRSSIQSGSIPNNAAYRAPWFVYTNWQDLMMYGRGKYISDTYMDTLPHQRLYTHYPFYRDTPFDQEYIASIYDYEGDHYNGKDKRFVWIDDYSTASWINAIEQRYSLNTSIYDTGEGYDTSISIWPMELVDLIYMLENPAYDSSMLFTQLYPSNGEAIRDEQLLRELLQDGGYMFSNMNSITAKQEELKKFADEFAAMDSSLSEIMKQKIEELQEQLKNTTLEFVEYNMLNKFVDLEDPRTLSDMEFLYLVDEDYEDPGVNFNMYEARDASRDLDFEDYIARDASRDLDFEDYIPRDASIPLDFEGYVARDSSRDLDFEEYIPRDASIPLDFEEYIARLYDPSINFEEYIARLYDPSIHFAEWAARVCNSSIDFSEFVWEVREVSNIIDGSFGYDDDDEEYEYEMEWGDYEWRWYNLFHDVSIPVRLEGRTPDYKMNFSEYVARLYDPSIQFETYETIEGLNTSINFEKYEPREYYLMIEFADLIARAYNYYITGGELDYVADSSNDASALHFGGYEGREYLGNIDIQSLIDVSSIGKNDYAALNTYVMENDSSHISNNTIGLTERIYSQELDLIAADVRENGNSSTSNVLNNIYNQLGDSSLVRSSIAAIESMAANSILDEHEELAEYTIDSSDASNKLSVLHGLNTLVSAPQREHNFKMMGLSDDFVRQRQMENITIFDTSARSINPYIPLENLQSSNNKPDVDTMTGLYNGITKLEIPLSYQELENASKKEYVVTTNLSGTALLSGKQYEQVITNVDLATLDLNSVSKPSIQAMSNLQGKLETAITSTKALTEQIKETSPNLKSNELYKDIREQLIQTIKENSSNPAMYKNESNTREYEGKLNQETYGPDTTELYASGNIETPIQDTPVEKAKKQIQDYYSSTAKGNTRKKINDNMEVDAEHKSAGTPNMEAIQKGNTRHELFTDNIQEILDDSGTQTSDKRFYGGTIEDLTEPPKNSSIYKDKL